MSAIVGNPPVLLRDGNVIAEGFDSELDELTSNRDHASQFLIDLEIKERETTAAFRDLKSATTASVAIILS